MHPVVVSVDNLPSEGKTIRLEYEAAEVGALLADAELSGVQASGKLIGEVRVMPSGRDVFVLGTLKSRLAYECARCLEPFEEDVEAEFHSVYTRETEGTAGEVELRREDLDVQHLESPTLNLTRDVEEQLLLVLNPHPVCREACLGLCPSCGGNRNLSECSCEKKASDPRFAALEILRQLKNE